MSNKHRTVFYTGITNNLIRRVFEHKDKLIKGFTSKYNINELIYFEEFGNPEYAILREKQIKDYRRSKKLELIQRVNPQIEDLYSKIAR